jgi:hypothetical protein
VRPVRRRRPDCPVFPVRRGRLGRGWFRARWRRSDHGRPPRPLRPPIRLAPPTALRPPIRLAPPTALRPPIRLALPRVPRTPTRFLDDLADRLAIGVASVVAVLDPGCVVLGGEVGQAGGEVLARRVEERIRRMSPLPTVVRPSSLGGSAVLLGALLTARDQAQDELFGPPDMP